MDLEAVLKHLQELYPAGEALESQARLILAVKYAIKERYTQQFRIVELERVIINRFISDNKEVK